ncbi:hypothetical protein [Nostoc sp.]|uniref:hypothetical protein n=1 Tax=Nostoc sp. TaxID=1180 RepID=UPI002FF97D87
MSFSIRFLRTFNRAGIALLDHLSGFGTGGAAENVPSFTVLTSTPETEFSTNNEVGLLSVQ